MSDTEGAQDLLAALRASMVLPPQKAEVREPTLLQAIANLVRPYMEEMTEATMVARDVLAVVEAHLRPVVTTVAELGALPEFAVVKDKHGAILERDSEGGWDDRVWWPIGDDRPLSASAIDLPATVLYRPEDAQ